MNPDRRADVARGQRVRLGARRNDVDAIAAARVAAPPLIRVPNRLTARPAPRTRRQRLPLLRRPRDRRRSRTRRLAGLGGERASGEAPDRDEAPRARKSERVREMPQAVSLVPAGRTRTPEALSQPQADSKSRSPNL